MITLMQQTETIVEGKGINFDAILWSVVGLVVLAIVIYVVRLIGGVPLDSRKANIVSAVLMGLLLFSYSMLLIPAVT